MSDIWKRHIRIMKERREKIAELINDYDDEIYLPALKQLREDCSKEGHGDIECGNNGYGYYYYYCSRCGARME